MNQATSPNHPQDLGQCLMGCGPFVKKIFSVWSSYDLSLRRPLGMCRRCGHVQLSPLPSRQEYAEINQNYFSSRYHRATLDQRERQNQRKQRRTLQRITPFVSQAGGSLLDFGAGDGWAMAVAREIGHQYHALEAVPSLAAQLKERGAVIVDPQPERLPEKHAAAFDLIIMRHVLEHLPDPVQVLTNLRKCLKPGGFLYLALPNLRTLSAKRGVRTDFFRPVHLSYYTANKLAWHLQMAGFGSIHLGCQGELWAVAGQGSQEHRLLDESQDNLAMLKSFAQQARFKDLFNIILLVQSRLRKGRSRT